MNLSDPRYNIYKTYNISHDQAGCLYSGGYNMTDAIDPRATQRYAFPFEVVYLAIKRAIIFSTSYQNLFFCNRWINTPKCLQIDPADSRPHFPLFRT